MLWGFYQGCTLCIYRIWVEYKNKGSSAPLQTNPGTSTRHTLSNLAAAAAFFVVVCYGWLLFRAHSLEQVVKFSSLLLTDFGDLNYGGRMPRLSSLLGMGLLLAIELTQYCLEDSQFYLRFPVILRSALIASMIVIILIGMSNAPAQFIYFQF